jgi:acyl carrier protein
MDGEKILRTFLKERFGNYRDTLPAEDPLDGVVESLGLFELVEFIEREFQISVPTEEFSPRRFSSISVILNTIEELRV